MLEEVELTQERPTRRSDLLQALAKGKNGLVAVGAMGVILTSKTGDDHWQRQVLDDKPFLMDVDACPDGSFIALDYDHRLWLSDDGDVWVPKRINSAETSQAATCDPRGVVWVVGGFSTIVSSSDKGDSWNSLSLDEDTHYTSIQFVNPDVAYLTGEFGVVVRTTDGGENWELLDPLPDEFYPHAAYFKDAYTGWVVGLNGTVLHTKDGASTWQRQNTNTEAPLYGIELINNRLVAVGGNGTILLEKDDEWQIVNHDQAKRFYLRGVLSSGNAKVLVAGGAGSLFEISLDGLL
ncbi:MAG: YCF48-related protein [Gammaproteobacteria bacterium]|nr:YCF48-related protein [Gammaproteobacteria bacterium]